MGYDRALILRLLEKNPNMTDLVEIIEGVDKHKYVEDVFGLRSLCYICG